MLYCVMVWCVVVVVVVVVVVAVVDIVVVIVALVIVNTDDCGILEHPNGKGFERGWKLLVLAR